MSHYNDFSSDPNSPNSPGFSNYQNQPGGFTSLLAGNTNTPPQPHQLAMNEWQQFQQFQQFQQRQQQSFSQPQSYHQPQSFNQPQPQSFHQPQQQAFSQPQQPQVAEPSRPRKRKDKGKKVAQPTDEPNATPTSRSVQWSQVQERRLAENWIHVSEDRKKGNDQDGLTFWYRVMAIFNEGLSEPFTKNSLSSKWRAMSRSVKLFSACHDRAHRDRTSGEDDKVVYTNALRMFEAENARAFRHHSAFEVLHNAPKFANPEPIDPINLDDDAEPDFFGHDKIPRPLGRPRPSKSARSSSSSDVTSKREEFNEDLVTEIRELKLAKTAEIKLRMRHRKMEFLLMPTDNLPPRDWARIEKQKDKYRAELDIEEGDEDEDED